MKIKDYMDRPSDKIEKKYFLMYCRKSSESEDRQCESISDQRNILTELAKTKGISILKGFEESHSAKAPGRPLFDEMTSLIETRDDIRGVVCWKLNRLFRNPKDEGAVRWFMQSGKILEIITPHKTYLEADSDFTMAVEGAQSQRFITDLKQDTKRGLDNKLNKGIFPGIAPPGYTNNTFKRQGERDISPGNYFTLMRKVFELALTGNFSVTSLCKQSEGLGVRNSRGKPISKSAMYKCLTNPFYTGKFVYSQQLYQGIHKPMLTADEFDLLQDILSSNGHPRKVDYNLPLTGLIRCGECGMMITGETKHKTYKNGKTQTFDYYHCTKKSKTVKCSQKYVKSGELEKQVNDYLGTIKLSQRFVDWAIKWVNVANEEQNKVRQDRYNALKANYEETVVKIKNLLDLYLSSLNKDKTVLTDTEYTAKKQELLIQKTREMEELGKVDNHINEWLDMAEKTFKFACTAQERFANGTIEDKKTILRAIGSHLTIKDKQLQIEPRTPFLIISKALVVNRLAPEEKIDVMTQTPLYLPQNSSWGGRRDSHPRSPAPQAGALTTRRRPP